MIGEVSSDPLLSGLVLIIAFIIHGVLSYRQVGLGWTFGRRVVFMLMALIGLYGVLYPPTVSYQEKRYNAIIKTENADIDQLDSISRSQLEMLVYETIDQYLIADKIDLIDTVFLLGIGLHPDQAYLLGDKYILCISPPTTSGITSLNYNDAEANRDWRLQLALSSDIRESIINTPRGNSIALDVNDQHQVDINLPGIAAGRYEYVIQTITRDDDTISTTLPLRVNPVRTYSLLTILEAPSFEANYLKNYWSELGNAYAQRLQVSKGRYLQSFVNRASVGLETIENADLANIDFVIIDVLSWNQLTDNERARILRRVNEEGLGLIVNINANQLAVGLPQIELSKLEEQKLDGSNTAQIINTRKLEKRGSWSIINYNNIEVGYVQRRGAGHIGYIGVEDSYKLLLADQSAAYQALWAQLLSAFYVNTDVPYLIQTADHTWEGEPAELTIFSNAALTAPMTVNDTTTLSWMNNPLIENSYITSVVPTPGWNTLKIADETPFFFYAHSKDELYALRYQRNKSALLLSEIAKASNQITRSKRPISPWLPWSIVIAGMGLLWLDERLWS